MSPKIHKALLWLIGLLAAFPVILLLLYVVFGIKCSWELGCRAALALALAVCLTPLIGLTEEMEK